MEKLLFYVPWILSVVALTISIKAWHKSRAIYGVERAVIRQNRGSRDDLDINEKSLNEKLSNGDYTMLFVMERKADKDWEILLGRIKPYNKIKDRLQDGGK